MQGCEKFELLISRVWKIASDNTALGHIVSDNDAKRISNVPFFEVCGLIALELIIGHKCEPYVPQLLFTAKHHTPIIASRDELRIYVPKLLIIAECNTSRIASRDELRIYVPKLLVIAECNTSRIAIGDELRKCVQLLLVIAIALS